MSKEHGSSRITYVEGEGALTAHLAQILQPSTVILLAGAGDVYKAKDAIIEVINRTV